MNPFSRGCIAVAAVLAMLGCSSVQAQARGPALRRDNPAEAADKPKPAPRASRRNPAGGIPRPVIPPEEVLDDAARELALQELDPWLRRLPGRFRIDGLIQKPDFTRVPGAAIPTLLEGKVSGVADCAGVGNGVGVNCIINATWRGIEINFPRFAFGAPIPQRPNTEALDSLQPAILVLGLDPDSPGVRALLVADDSLSHGWAGRLQGNTLLARRTIGCLDASPPDPRCFEPLEITAEPDSEVVEVVLRASNVTIKLTMYRDPDVAPQTMMRRR